MESRLVRSLYFKEVSPGVIGVYNPIQGHNFAFISKDLFNTLRQRKPVDGKYVEDLEKLREKKFIVPEDFSEKSYFDGLRKNLEIDIHLMYLLVSQDCNLACSYCFEELPLREKGLMPLDIAEKAVDFFFRISTPKRKIIFYGGEPLLNKKVVRAAISRIRSYEEKAPSDIVVITNGTLVDRNTARFLSDNKVNVSVSIDGPEALHDISRIDRLGRGSYSRAIKGYRLLKESGVNPSISCTIGEHNLEQLVSIAEFFSGELKPFSVGFNLLIRSNGNGMPFEGYSETATKNLLEAFETLRNHGIYEDRIMRRLEKVCNGECYLKECAAYGNQIVVRYDGKVGPCHAFSPTGEFFTGDIKREDFKINPEIFDFWARRNPLNNVSCENCPAITLCGGGCAFNAHTETGDINSIDKSICIHTYRLIDWVLQRTWEKLNGVNIPKL